jgi:hypothetical protein
VTGDKGYCMVRATHGELNYKLHDEIVISGIVFMIFQLLNEMK